jgi:outer membrane protein assembly factor BamB
VNNFIKFLLIFILLTNCSLQKNSKFWTNKKISEEKKEYIVEFYKKEQALNLELNPNLKISLISKSINKSFLNNFDNNNGRINYDGNLENVSKFRFSKIENFYQYNPELSFENNNIIFFNNKGTILKFNNDSDLLWEKNYYSKTEKKQNPILFFANNKKVLIVVDNLAKFYALDINTGELLWKKKNLAPFNSQIKIYKNKFFVVDFDNTLRSYSIKDGSEIWNVKTENSLIRTQKKLSIVIIEDKVYFNNSIGDINAVDINSGELVWQIPTQSSLVYDESFYLKTSDMITTRDTMFFSNNNNQFFSIDLDSGTLNWQTKINSTLRSTLVDNYLFTVSMEGYLLVVEKNSGKIIRATDIFKNIKPKKRNKIKPTGFIMGNNNIYLTTDNGRLFVIDIATGKTISILKIDNSKILRPLVLNQNLYVVSDNSIIKLN